MDLFSRSVSSITNELKKRDHKKIISVFDDSTSSDTRDTKRKITLQIQESTGQYISYIGYEEKHSFINKLLEALPLDLHSSARFFIFGDKELSYLKGPGGNRNAALSAFAGKSFISIDDDTELKLYQFKDSKKIITIEKEKPNLNIGAYADIESIEEKIELFPDDPFAIIDSILGNETNDLLPGSNNGKVCALMLGIYGGRWFSRPFGILFQEGDSRHPTFSSKTKYKEVKFNPYCYIQSPNILLTDSPFFISTAIGIDATSIVPPFFPHTRNEDNAWTILLKKCYDNSYIAHLPFAIWHEKNSKAPFNKNDFKKSGSDLGLNITYTLFTISEQLLCPKGVNIYELLGKTLIGFSELSQQKWVGMCRAMWHKHVEDTVNSLNLLLEKYENEPYFWAKDVKKYMDRLKSTSMDAEAFIPRELHSAGSVEEAGKIHRRMLNSYGTLLTQWPQIWDVICKMNEAGEGLLGRQALTP